MAGTGGKLINSGPGRLGQFRGAWLTIINFLGDVGVFVILFRGPFRPAKGGHVGGGPHPASCDQREFSNWGDGFPGLLGGAKAATKTRLIGFWGMPC